MVVTGLVALLAIVGMTGLANTSGWLARIRLKAVARDMSTNFQYAKMEAIRQNSFCTIVFNQAVGGTTYTYIVFPEPAGANRNLVYTDGTDPAPIKRVRLSDYKSTITLDTTLGGGDGLSFANNTAGKPAFCFDQKGLPRNGAVATVGGGTVFLKDEYGNRMSVVINNAGQITIQ